MNKKLLVPKIVFFISLIWCIILNAEPYYHYNYTDKNELVQEFIDELKVELIDDESSVLESYEEEVLIEDDYNLANDVNSERSNYVNKEQILEQKIKKFMAFLEKIQTQNIELETLTRTKQHLITGVFALFFSLLMSVLTYSIQEFFRIKEIKEFFKKNSIPNSGKILIGIFVLCVIIMIIYIQFRNDEEALCFAFLAGSALISYTSVLKSNR